MTEGFMITDGPQLGILCFMLAVLAAASGTAVLVVSLLLKRYQVARWVALLGVGGGAFYAAMLLVVSVEAPSQVLALGQEKHFCEFDCHMAYAVTGVTTARTLGPPRAQVTAQGTFRVVTLRVRFDEKTIAPFRGNAPLWPSPRWKEVRDARGTRYLQSLDGQAAWEAANGMAPGLDRPLRPGQSYTTTLVFDLPEGVRDPQLVLTTPAPETVFVIGNENSFFHRKATFRI
jgi:hypothetical protein